VRPRAPDSAFRDHGGRQTVRGFTPEFPAALLFRPISASFDSSSKCPHERPRPASSADRADTWGRGSTPDSSMAESAGKGQGFQLHCLVRLRSVRSEPPTSSPEKDAPVRARHRSDVPDLPWDRVLVGPTMRTTRVDLLPRGARGLRRDVRDGLFVGNRRFAIVKEVGPRRLVSDIGMPGEDGYTFIRRMPRVGAAVRNFAFPRSRSPRTRGVRTGLRPPRPAIRSMWAKPIDPIGVRAGSWRGEFCRAPPEAHRRPAVVALPTPGERGRVGGLVLRDHGARTTSAAGRICPMRPSTVRPRARRPWRSPRGLPFLWRRGPSVGPPRARPAVRPRCLGLPHPIHTNGYDDRPAWRAIRFVEERGPLSPASTMAPLVGSGTRMPRRATHMTLCRPRSPSAPAQSAARKAAVRPRCPRPRPRATGARPRVVGSGVERP
jgi:hypothetical protein